MPTRQPNPLGTLPAKASRMWEAVFESAQDRGFPPGPAAAQAWCAVKRRYRKKGARWLKRKKPLRADQSPPGCTHMRQANPFTPTGFTYDGRAEDATGLTIEEAAVLDCGWAEAILRDCATRDECRPDLIRVRVANGDHRVRDEMIASEAFDGALVGVADAVANPRESVASIKRRVLR